MDSKVHIVVLNWNGWSDTSACLSSLQQLHYGNYRVIVVDNGSTDDSVERIRKGFPWADLIETGKNLGFAGGCNAGIRQGLAQGADFIWLLNNDTVVDPGALQALVNKAKTDPRIGAVGSAIYCMEDREHLQCWGGGYISFLLGKGWHYLEPVQDEKLQFITGASLLLPRGAIKEIGVLDEGFFMYWEDGDYCFRLRRAGWRLAVAGNSNVWHRGSAFVGSKSAKIDTYFNASAARFFQKHAWAPGVPLWTGVALRLAKRAVLGDWERVRAVWAGAHGLQSL